MNYNELKQVIHANAKEKGFWDSVNISEKFMLIISELSEALEADRKRKYANTRPLQGDLYPEGIVAIDIPEVFIVAFEQYVKDTFEDEIADTVIRLLDFAGRENIHIGKYLMGEFNNVPKNIGKALYDLTKGVISIEQEFNNNEENTDKLSNDLTTLLAMFEGFCKSKGIDLEWHIKSKMEYNKTRPRLHGKAY